MVAWASLSVGDKEVHRLFKPNRLLLQLVFLDPIGHNAGERYAKWFNGFQGPAGLFLYEWRQNASTLYPV